MDANEKAQRLALLTNIKFRLDNITGDIIESDEPIPQSVIDEAMAMSDAEFKLRSNREKRKIFVSELRLNYSVRAAYKAFRVSNPEVSLNDFIKQVVDEVEDEKQV